MTLLTLIQASRLYGFSRADIVRAMERGELVNDSPKPNRVLIRPDLMRKWAKSKEGK